MKVVNTRTYNTMWRCVFQVAKIPGSPIVLTTMDSVEDRVNQAVLQFTLGEEEVAETQLRAILQEHPSCVEAWRALAEVCLSRGNLDDAEQACRQALQLSPEDLTITVSLARILVNKGDKDGAEEATSKARILGWKEELAQDD